MMGEPRPACSQPASHAVACHHALPRVTTHLRNELSPSSFCECCAEPSHAHCRGANVAIHIAAALHYLAANHIFHGDIKCAA